MEEFHELELTLEIIQNITVIMELLIPGVIFLAINKALTGCYIQNVSLRVIAAIAISFMNKCVSQYLHKFIVPHISFSTESKFCFLIVIAMIEAILFGLAYQNKRIEKIFNHVFFKSFHGNIWESVLDFRAGNMLALGMKNGTKIYGTFHEIEEKGNDSWIVLREYSVDADSDDVKMLACEFNSYEYDSLLMVRVADIVQAQVFSTLPTKRVLNEKNRSDDKG